MNLRLLSRSFSAALSIVYLATNCAFAHKPETTMWDERRSAVKNVQLASAQFFPQLPAVMPSLQSLPLAYGTVRKTLVPARADKGKTVIHIQDVHMNAEAQRNIAATIQRLIDGKQVDLIALEGAFAPIDLAAFRNFPRQDAIRAVADYLLRENKISGPIHAAFVSPAPIPKIIGVDDSGHYRANVDAYKTSAGLLKESKARFASRQKTLLEEKSKVFNPRLAQFDRQVQSYRQGTLAMGDYVRFLAKQIPAATGEVKTFLDALNLESAMNFNEVEAERSRLLSRLLPKLTKNGTTELMNVSAAYRVGNISHADFYSHLQDLCDRNGIALSQFPSMKSYLRYTALAGGIDAERLFAGIKSAEMEAGTALARTDDEKRLLLESKRLFLIGKLLDFSLTKEEWKDFRAEDSTLKPFEAFYVEAEARDQAMAENLIKASPRSAVLVTGGFHSSGIDKRLVDAGYTVISFSPKITHLRQGYGGQARDNYLSVFTQEKTPLEKLFQGEKLFLANAPVNPAEAAAGAGLFLEARDPIHRAAQTDTNPLFKDGSRIETKDAPGEAVGTITKPDGRRVDVAMELRGQRIETFKSMPAGSTPGGLAHGNIILVLLVASLFMGGSGNAGLFGLLAVSMLYLIFLGVQQQDGDSFFPKDSATGLDDQFRSAIRKWLVQRGVPQADKVLKKIVDGVGLREFHRSTLLMLKADEDFLYFIDYKRAPDESTPAVLFIHAVSVNGKSTDSDPLLTAVTKIHALHNAKQQTLYGNLLPGGMSRTSIEKMAPGICLWKETISLNEDARLTLTNANLNPITRKLQSTKEALKVSYRIDLAPEPAEPGLEIEEAEISALRTGKMPDIMGPAPAAAEESPLDLLKQRQIFDRLFRPLFPADEEDLSQRFGLSAVAEEIGLHLIFRVIDHYRPISAAFAREITQEVVNNLTRLDSASLEILSDFDVHTLLRYWTYNNAIPSLGHILRIAAPGWMAVMQLADFGYLSAREGVAPIYSVAYSPDGRWMAIPSGNKIALFNTRTGENIEVLTIPNNPDAILCLKFSPDSRYLASGDSSGGLNVWEIFGGQRRDYFQARNRIRAIHFNPDGRMVTAIDAFKTIYIRDWQNHTSPTYIDDWTDGGLITSAIFTPDGRDVSSIDEHESADIYSFQTRETNEVDTDVTALSLSQDGRHILIARAIPDKNKYQYRIVCRDVGTRTLISQWDFPIEITALALSPNGKILVVGTIDPSSSPITTGVAFINFQTHTIMDSSNPYREGPNSYPLRIKSIQFSPDGRMVLTGCTNGEAGLWKVPAAFQTPVIPVLLMAFLFALMSSFGGWDGLEISMIGAVHLAHKIVEANRNGPGFGFLTEGERAVLNALFPKGSPADGPSAREAATTLSIPLRTLEYRKQKGIAKLHAFQAGEKIPSSKPGRHRIIDIHQTIISDLQAVIEELTAQLPQGVKPKSADVYSAYKARGGPLFSRKNYFLDFLNTPAAASIRPLINSSRGRPSTLDKHPAIIGELQTLVAELTAPLYPGEKPLLADVYTAYKTRGGRAFPTLNQFSYFLHTPAGDPIRRLITIRQGRPPRSQSLQIPGAVATSKNLQIARERGLAEVGWREHKIAVSAFILVFPALAGVWALLFASGFVPLGPPIDSNGALLALVSIYTAGFAFLSFFVLLVAHRFFGVINRVNLEPQWGWMISLPATWTAWSSLMISVLAVFVGAGIAIVFPSILTIAFALALSAIGIEAGGARHAKLNTGDLIPSDPSLSYDRLIRQISDLNREIANEKEENQIFWPAQKENRDTRVAVALREKLLGAKNSPFVIEFEEKDDVLLGYILYRIASAEPGMIPGAVYVDQLGVRPSHSGQGAGARLMEKAFRFALAQGARHVFLGCYKVNERGNRFYKSLPERLAPLVKSVEVRPVPERDYLHQYVYSVGADGTKIISVSSDQRLAAIVANKDISKFHFNRQTLQISYSNELNPRFNLIQEAVDKLKQRFEKSHGVRVLGTLVNNNLGPNDGTVCYTDHRLHANAKELKANVINNQTYWSSSHSYSVLVQWEDGRKSIEQALFTDFRYDQDAKAFVEGKVLIRDDSAPTSEDRAAEIITAYSGQLLVEKGKAVPLDQIAAHFADMNHLFQLPRLSTPEKAMKSLYIGLAELTRNQGKAETALRGETILLGLEELPEATDIPAFLSLNGYHQVFDADQIKERGQFFLRPDRKTVAVKLLPGVNPLSLIALKKNGDLDIILITGESRVSGSSIEEAQRELVKKYEYVFLFAQGRDIADLGEKQNKQASSLLMVVPTLKKADGTGSQGDTLQSPTTLGTGVFSPLKKLTILLGIFMSLAQGTARGEIFLNPTGITQEEKGRLTRARAIIFKHLDPADANLLRRAERQATIFKDEPVKFSREVSGGTGQPEGFAADGMTLEGKSKRTGAITRYIVIAPKAFKDEVHLIAVLSHEVQMLLILLKGESQGRSQSEIEILGATRSNQILRAVAEDIPPFRANFEKYIDENERMIKKWEQEAAKQPANQDPSLWETPGFWIIGLPLVSLAGAGLWVLWRRLKSTQLKPPGGARSISLFVPMFAFSAADQANFPWDRGAAALVAASTALMAGTGALWALREHLPQGRPWISFFSARVRRLVGVALAFMAVDQLLTLTMTLLLPDQQGIGSMGFFYETTTTGRTGWIVNSLLFGLFSLWLWFSGRLSRRPSHDDAAGLNYLTDRIRLASAIWLGAWMSIGSERLIKGEQTEYFPLLGSFITAAYPVLYVASIVVLGYSLLFTYAKYEINKNRLRLGMMRLDYQVADTWGWTILAVFMAPLLVGLDQLAKYLALTYLKPPASLDLGSLIFPRGLSPSWLVIRPHSQSNNPFGTILITTLLIAFLAIRDWSRIFVQDESENPLPSNQKKHRRALQALALCLIFGAIIADGLNHAGIWPSIGKLMLKAEAFSSFLSPLVLIIGLGLLSLVFLERHYGDGQNDSRLPLAVVIVGWATVLSLHFFLIRPLILHFALLGAFRSIFATGAVPMLPLLTWIPGAIAALFLMWSLASGFVLWLFLSGKLFPPYETLRFHPGIERDAVRLQMGVAMFVASLACVTLDIAFHGAMIGWSPVLDIGDILFALGWFFIFRGIGGMRTAELRSLPTDLHASQSGDGTGILREIESNLGPLNLRLGTALAENPDALVTEVREKKEAIVLVDEEMLNVLSAHPAFFKALVRARAGNEMPLVVVKPAVENRTREALMAGGAREGRDYQLQVAPEVFGPHRAVFADALDKLLSDRDKSLRDAILFMSDHADLQAKDQTLRKLLEELDLAGRFAAVKLNEAVVREFLVRTSA